MASAGFLPIKRVTSILKAETTIKFLSFLQAPVSVDS